ncbi:MAG: hypothetical protein ACHREM_12625 [Polyangiales bacterium]
MGIAYEVPESISAEEAAALGIAGHELAHACVAMVFDRCLIVESVSIYRDALGGIAVYWPKVTGDLESLVAAVSTSLAGERGYFMATGDALRAVKSASVDYQSVEEHLAAWSLPPESADFVKSISGQVVETTLSDPTVWRSIAALIPRLVDQGTIDGADVEKSIRIPDRVREAVRRLVAQVTHRRLWG